MVMNLLGEYFSYTVYERGVIAIFVIASSGDYSIFVIAASGDYSINNSVFVYLDS